MLRFQILLLIIYTYIAFFATIGLLYHGLLLPNFQQSTSNNIVSMAKEYLGVPYRYGGTSPSGFDCSGYMLYLFGQFGQQLPRTADQQATVGIPVAFTDLRPGHLICFAPDKELGITHSGLYIGNQQFIHASSSAKKVIISSLTEPYWETAFRTARQILY